MSHQVDAMAYALNSLSERPGPESHTCADRQCVVCAELVACTLGQRHRPELRPRGKEAIEAMYFTDAGGDWPRRR